MKLTSKKLWLVVTMMVMGNQSYSAPNISSISSSAISQNANITIQGVGFGTHANYGGGQPFLNAAWTDFESGSLNGGNFFIETEYQPTNWRLVSSGERTGSSFHAKQELVSQRLGALSYNQTLQANEFYNTFWFKTTSLSIAGKFWRIYGNDPGKNIYISTGGTDTMIRGYSECTACSPAPATQWGSPNSFVINQWHRVEIIMKRSPDEFRVYLDGVEQWHRVSSLGDNQYVYPNYNGVGHTMDVGNMMENAGSWNFDDVYIDYTRARVELGNASTWASCTIREIQIPTAWSDNSITVKVNKGSFTSGTVYLFVIDSMGNVSNSYPVIINGDTNILSNPTDLKINNPN